MSADPEFSRKVREERRRRRRELAKQREQDPNAKYDASNKFTQQQIDAANKVAADHATNLHNDCDDTLDRILKTAHDTHDTGAKTLHQIHSQQEQLRKIHKDLHEIDQDQKDTESSLRTISSWGGQFKSWWKGDRKRETYKGMKADKNRKRNETQNHSQNHVKKTKRRHQFESENKKIASLEKKDKSSMNHKERKQLRNHKMEQLNFLADDLNEMALIMSTELQHQGEQVQEISNTMTDVNEAIVDKNVKMEKIRRG